MKKLLTIAAIAAASTALAVESSNTFGILRVDSTAAQTIVSVPWEGAGATGDDAGKIMVKDIVKTANLTKETATDQADGDMLYLYTGGRYYAWYLSFSGVWKGIQVSASDGLPAAANDDTKKISRGDAIILVRKHPETGSFYLYGQYAALTSSDVTTVVAGNAETLAYTLLAPPTTESFNLNGTGVMTGDPNAADRIAVPNNDGQSLALLKYDSANGGWGIKKSTFDTSKATIPAGQGVWYVSRGGSPTFNWNPSAQ